MSAKKSQPPLSFLPNPVPDPPGRVITMLTACFSHKSLTHFAFNHIAMWSFAVPLYYMMGQEPFLAFSLSAGGVGARHAQQKRTD